MLDKSIFISTDTAIAATGSDDPFAVMEYYNIPLIPLYGTIIAYAVRISYLAMIGINEKLDRFIRSLVAWHELTHVFERDIDDPAFAFKEDKGIFTMEVDSWFISRREKVCNLVSADHNIDTGLVREMIGYDNSIMKDYRKLCAAQRETTKAYEQLRSSLALNTHGTAVSCRMAEYEKQLQSLNNRRIDLEAVMIADNCTMSLSQIAAELGCSVTVLKYKLEAMRLRGMDDINLQELAAFDKVFDKLA